MGSSRVVAATVATALLAGSVFAQPSAADKQQAGELTKQAIAKAGAKDYDGAIELYLKAYALFPAPQLLSNIGTEYQNAQNRALALKYFCLYLDKEPTGNLAGYASSKAKTLYLELGGKPVDDKDVCIAPIPSPVVTTTTVEQTTVITPPVAAPVARDAGKPLKIAGIATAGAGLVVLGFGLYFGKVALDHDHEISNHGSEMWMDNIADYEAEGRRAEKLQIAFDIAGGVMIVAGAAMYFVGRGKSSREVVVTPTASASGAGVSLSGAF